MSDHTPQLPLFATAPHDPMLEIPYGYCHCGCGQKTSITPSSDATRGLTKGQPHRFINGHRPAYSVHDRFWQNVAAGNPDDCWEWQGNLNAYGYGRLCFNKKIMLAHRASYELHHGSIPDSLHVCHRCDNPRCVNPRHLWLGTAADNARDREAKGRCPHLGTPGEAGGSKLKESDIVEIRMLHNEGTGTTKIAQQFGVTNTSIRSIIRRKTWRHVP